MSIPRPASALPPVARLGAIANDASGGEVEDPGLRRVVRALVARILGERPGHPDVEDCTHEVLRRAIEGRARLEPGVPVRPWALGIARHVAIDARRARRRARGRLVEDTGEGAPLVERLIDPGPPPDDAVHEVQQRSRVAAAMTRLPKGPRRALELLHVEGLGYQQIAERLEVPLGTVATWVSRGPTRARRGPRPGTRAGKEALVTLRERLLPDEIAWDADGHASDASLAALADGEEAIVPAAAVAHVDGCASCAARLGDAALFMVGAAALLSRREAALGGQTGHVAPERSRRVPRRVPYAAIAAALVVAGVSAVPRSMEAVAEMPATAGAVTRALPLVAHGAVVFLQHGGGGLGPAAIAACVGAAVALVWLATTIVRGPRLKRGIEEGGA